jgi:hypothetical protein
VDKEVRKARDGSADVQIQTDIAPPQFKIAFEQRASTIDQSYNSYIRASERLVNPIMISNNNGKENTHATPQSTNRTGGNSVGTSICFFREPS